MHDCCRVPRPHFDRNDDDGGSIDAVGKYEILDMKTHLHFHSTYTRPYRHYVLPFST